MANISKARTMLRELRIELPRRPARLLDALDSITRCLEEKGPDIVPSLSLESLELRIKELRERIEEAFPPEEEEERTVPDDGWILHGVIDIDASLQALQRHLVEADSYRTLLDLFERIDSVLPARDYDFTAILDSLKADLLGEDLIAKLTESINRYRQQHYAECLLFATETYDLLKTKSLDYVQTVTGGTQVLISAGEARTRLKKKCAASARNRTEWLLLHLLQLSGYIRHLKEHLSEGERDIPEWMKDRRRLLGEDCGLARLQVICQLHAALELQELLVHIGQEAVALEIQSSAGAAEAPVSALPSH